MTGTEWIAQAIGILGTVLTLSCFHWSKRRSILKNKIIMDVVWAAHYFLLGAYAGFFTNVICFFRELVFMNNDKKLFRSRAWLWIFVGCNWVAALLTWKGAFSILPATASTLATIGFWQKRVKVTRYIAVGNTFLMMIYDLCVGSYTGILNEALACISTISACILHRKDRENAA